VEPEAFVSWTGHRPWTGDHELDRIELGERVTVTSDDGVTIAWRFAATLPSSERADLFDWSWAYPPVFGVRSLPNTKHPGSS
jgi:hypothetical protein